jgi:hypothetical protein
MTLYQPLLAGFLGVVVGLNQKHLKLCTPDAWRLGRGMAEMPRMGI